jgi:hypothetical protein
MSIEAMKQALEALEAIRSEKMFVSVQLIAKNARYSLRQAIAEAEKESTLQEISDIGQKIEQAEKQEPDGWVNEYDRFVKKYPSNDIVHSWKPVYTAPPKQEIEQEPVGEVIQALQPTGWTGKVMVQKIVQFDQTLPVGTKLYTAPPKREIDMSTKPEKIDTSAELVHEIDKSIHEEIERLKAEIKRLKGLAEYRLQLLINLPEKEWVGLTDEEIDEIYKQNHNQYNEDTTGEYEREIEAKLRERNT